MKIRRLPPLTNGFSKKSENLDAALPLHFGYCNFCGIDGTLGVTAAMAASVTHHVWTLEELLQAGKE